VTRVLVGIGVASLGLAVACGGGSPSPSGQTNQRLSVELKLSICDSASSLTTAFPACQSFRQGNNPGLLSATVTALQRRAAAAQQTTTVMASGRDEIDVITTMPLPQASLWFGESESIAFATPVAGAPDPSSPTFLADQGGRFDANQLNNPVYYPIGYHWKIDHNIDSSDVTSADVGTDPNGQVAVNITFSSHGAGEWSLITTAAFHAAQGTPENRVAIFLDNEVVTAPDVLSGGQSNQTQIVGNFTSDMAAALVAATAAGPLPAPITRVATGPAPSQSP
jgi:preprotein translocase subunit SecD